MLQIPRFPGRGGLLISGLAGVLIIVGSTWGVAGEFRRDKQRSRGHTGLEAFSLPTLPTTADLTIATLTPEPTFPLDLTPELGFQPGSLDDASGSPGVLSTEIEAASLVPPTSEETWDTQTEHDVSSTRPQPVSGTGVDMRGSSYWDVLSDRLGLRMVAVALSQPLVPRACGLVAGCAALLSGLVLKRRRKDRGPASIVRDLETCRCLYTRRGPTC